MSPPAFSPPPRRLIFLVFLALGALLFFAPLREAPRYRSGDWGPHHALTRTLARGVAFGQAAPHYLTGFSTGAAPFETYPLPAYALAAGLTYLAGDEAAPGVLALLGVLCHVAIAAGVARLAAHFAPLPLALLVGLAALFDTGSFESGGAQTVLEVGLLHNALAQALALLAFDLVLVILSRGPGMAAIGLWCFAFLSAATHPSGLLFLLPLPLALLLVAAFAREAVPRRAFSAALHLLVGLLLAAPFWGPVLARTLPYGLHLATPAPSLPEALAGLVSLERPASSWPLLVGLGLAGVVLALVRRRGPALLLAAHTLLLLAASTDLAHRLLFDAFPRLLVRWQGFRFVTLARPLIFVAAAALLGLLWRSLRRAGPLRSGRLLPAAALAVVAAAGIATRSADFPAGFERLRALAKSGVPDPDGFHALLEWARQQRSASDPRDAARILWEAAENAGYHLTAESGLPVFAIGDALGMMLRERIEDRGAESLRRFNARWVVFRERPSWLGDASGERSFGSYKLREIEGWDGRLARIEKGEGDVRVSELGPERVLVELSRADSPALVALGIGYYPRWRARLADGRPLPIFALPATPGGSVRVVAAWIPPGRTLFTADGPLPSDGAGRSLGLAGAGLAALTLALWPLAGSRRFAKRLLPLLRRRRLRAAAALALVVVAVAMLWAARRPGLDASLKLVPGWLPAAQVEARSPGGTWTACGFSTLRRDFDCGTRGRISDATGFVIRDHQSSTAYLTPGIVARPAQNRVEYRVVLQRRLAGRHWAAAWGPGGASLRCAGPAVDLERAKLALHFEAAQTECELLLRTRGRSVQGITVVGQAALDIDRSRDVPWAPERPPKEVEAAAAR